MDLIERIADNVAANPKKRDQLKTSIISFGAAGAIMAGAMAYDQFSEPIAQGAAHLRDSTQESLMRAADTAYAPHIERAREETVGFVSLAPDQGQGIYDLISKTWTVESENERGALLRYVQELNGLENASIRADTSYLLPVDSGNAARYGMNE